MLYNQADKFSIRILATLSFLIATFLLTSNLLPAFAYVSETNLAILSPLKQLKSGISPKDIQCRSELQLMIKEHNNFPACVKLKTILSLANQGWTLPNEILAGYNFSIKYGVIGGKFLNFENHGDFFLLNIETDSNGYLIAMVPKGRISSCTGLNVPVLVDEKMIIPPQKLGDSMITFEIPFQNGTRIIQFASSLIGCPSAN